MISLNRESLGSASGISRSSIAAPIATPCTANPRSSDATVLKSRNNHPVRFSSRTRLYPRMIDRLALLRAGAAESWEELREPGEPPMPLTEAPVEDVLAEMADVLRDTDLIWPRPDDEGFVELRALAWSRCAPYQPDRPEFEPLPDAERPRRSTR